MALVCTPSAINANAVQISGMTDHSLLAGILYALCTANNLNCTPSSLASASECLRCSMSEHSLLAGILWVLCSTGGGGGGGGTTCIIGGVGPPVGTPPCAFSIYVQQPGPNFGLWAGDNVTGWGNALVVQGP